MTVKEIIEMYRDDYVDIEFYKFFDRRHSVHSDFIRSIESMKDDEEPEYYELMNEEEYNSSILANISIPADFDMWYDDKNAKVLVIIADEHYGEDYDEDCDEDYDEDCDD